MQSNSLGTAIPTRKPYAINSKNTPFLFVIKSKNSATHSTQHGPPFQPLPGRKPPSTALCLVWLALAVAILTPSAAAIVRHDADAFRTYVCDNEANVTAQLDRTCMVTVTRPMLTQSLLFRSRSQPDRIKCLDCDVGTLRDRAGLRFSMDVHTIDLTGSHVEHVEAGAIAGTAHSLLLTYNALTTLDDVRVFQLTAQLRTLHLDHNELFYVNDRALDGLAELRELWLNHNRLVSVVARLFRHLPQLEKLRLHSNRLRQLDGNLLAANGQLRELTLFDNQLALVHDDMWTVIKRISIVDIVNVQIQLNRHAAEAKRAASEPNTEMLDQLEQFDAAGCRIASMNQYIPEQQLYNASCGNLTAVPSAAEVANGRFKYLNLRHNMIGDLDQTAFATADAFTSALLTVDLTHNVIESVHPNAFDTVVGLKELLLAHNFIRYLAPRLFAQLTGLLVLELHHNQLHTINAQQFWGTKRLQRLTLHDNRIVSVGAKAFDQLQRLELFDMSNNSVQNDVLIILNAKVVRMERSNVAFLLIGDRVCRLAAAHNRLRSLNLRHAHRLVHLNASDNRIDVVDMQTVKALKTLDLVGNRLTSISLEYNSLLQVVRLADNLLEEVHFNVTGALQSLDLSGNQLQTLELPTANMYQLHRLNVSKNQLTSLQSLVGLYTLNELDASENPLRDVQVRVEIGNLRHSTSLHLLSPIQVTAFQNMESLEALQLRGCDLTHMRPGVFRHLHALQRLDLSANNLTELAVLATFDGLHSLRQLRLNRNRLERLDAGRLLRTLPKLQAVGVSGNRWRCDVLADFVRKMEAAYVDVETEWESVVGSSVQGVRCTSDEDDDLTYVGGVERLTVDEGNGTATEQAAAGGSATASSATVMLMGICAVWWRVL